ncbi:mitochondrial carrier domain-containing protein [Melampsora americana]|nr:mitochondrial carrier domain-containing protein [Melampsora americana]
MLKSNHSNSFNTSSNLQSNQTSTSSSSSTSIKPKHSTSSHLIEYFIAGGTAGAMSRTVVSPLERLKIIFQCQGPGSKNYQGMWPSLVKIGKTEGWKGYFRGNGINVIRIAPYSAIQFSAYEVAKKLLTRLSPKQELNTPLRLTSGAIAGICSVVATYPLDLVRSRLSIISSEIGSRSKPNEKSSGIWKTTIEIYRTEGGLRGLYRGLIPTVIGVAPYVGSNFASYEFLKQTFCSADHQTSNSYNVLKKLACGAFAGGMSQTVTYPLDVLRRRMQVTGMNGMSFKYDGAWDATRTIIKKEGISGLYKGLWPNLLKVAPSIGTSFVTYEIVRDWLLAI